VNPFDKVGVESRISTYLPPRGASGTPDDELQEQVGKVRAEVRLSAPFPEGDWLAVEIVAQVFDREYVDQYGRTSEDALIAEGPAVAITVRRSRVVVDVPLPPMPYGRHPVVAKVYSVDERYRRLFDPSNCYLETVPFGYLSRIRKADLEDVYRGIGNPAAEEEIRRLVRAGAVIVDDEGKALEAREDNGHLVLRPFRQFEATAQVPQQIDSIATGVVAIEGTNLGVAEIFAKNGELMAGQLAPLVVGAARKSADVARRVQAMGPSPRFLYLLGKSVESGNRVEFPVSIYPRG
jgi:hypothetical protein